MKKNIHLLILALTSAVFSEALGQVFHFEDGIRYSETCGRLQSNWSSDGSVVLTAADFVGFQHKVIIHALQELCVVDLTSCPPVNLSTSSQTCYCKSQSGDTFNIHVGSQTSMAQRGMALQAVVPGQGPLKNIFGGATIGTLPEREENKLRKNVTYTIDDGAPTDLQEVQTVNVCAGRRFHLQICVYNGSLDAQLKISVDKYTVLADGGRCVALSHKLIPGQDGKVTFEYRDGCPQLHYIFLAGGCRSKVDLVVALDASTSVTEDNFDLMKDFIKVVLYAAEIGNDDMRVGIIIFSTQVYLQFHLNAYDSKIDLFNAIDDIEYRSGETNTADALKTMRVEMFTPENGDRPGVDNVAVLITGGESNIKERETIPEAELARAQGIRIHAIGIGLKNYEELDGIASRPVAENRFAIKDYSKLETLREYLFKSFCPEHLQACNIGQKNVATTTSTESSSTATTAKITTTPKPHAVAGVCPDTPRHVTTLTSGKKVLMDSVSFNLSWTVFQRRVSGEVDFFRPWADYEAGFGNVTDSYWLGLESIHELCNKKNKCELLVNVKYLGKAYLPPSADGCYYARYKFFWLGDASTNYTLNLRGYTGTAGDSMVKEYDLNNMQFSTKDRDNDVSSINCADSRHGAWWYHKCTQVNLNGWWARTSAAGVEWWALTERNSVSFTEMSVRRRT